MSKTCNSERYTCRKCKTVFRNSFSLKRHMRTKNDCKTGEERKNVKCFKCQYCDSTFSRKDNLKKHFVEKRCSEMPSDIENKLKINGSGNTTRIDNGVNTDNSVNADNSVKADNRIITIDKSVNHYDNRVNHIVANITLIAFEHEKVSEFTANDMKQIFGEGNILENYIRIINFNPDKSQFHNIYYEGIHCGFGEVYNGTDWVGY